MDAVALELNFNNYHPKLNLKYAITNGGLIFEDGVIYLQSEIDILKSNKDFNYSNIHLAKKIFLGEIYE